MNGGVISEVFCTTKFDDNSELSTTHLGRIDITTSDEIKAEERFPISEQGYTVGTLLDSTECHILLNTGANKSFMSKHII